ncbi:helix-turn-helix domain-containing protein [Paroceanicella profunda]|uniref:Helix-turn-helix domain-containing protein n=1 Tax=Paroceanicella profunda TaxID=2579971 RepID=A0A5B8FVQ3_9RHOB|nr:helix-turn-helix domain-containing protein [Paroceanicella profunda]
MRRLRRRVASALGQRLRALPGVPAGEGVRLMSEAQRTGEALMQPSRPFTPDALAERWECSSTTIRAMIRAGDLPAFRVGKLFRIPADAVMEYEACQNGNSEGSTADGSCRGGRTAAGAASASTRMIGKLRNARR